MKNENVTETEKKVKDLLKIFKKARKVEKRAQELCPHRKVHAGNYLGRDEVDKICSLCFKDLGSMSV